MREKCRQWFQARKDRGVRVVERPTCMDRLEWRNEQRERLLHRIRIYCAIALAALTLAGARDLEPQGAPSSRATGRVVPTMAIVPVPVEVTPGVGSFELNASTRLLRRQPHVDPDQAMTALADLVASGPGGRRRATAVGDFRATNAIILNFDSTHWPPFLRAAPSTEAYTLVVDSARIVIHARTAHGAFNAVQTLRQLLPVEIERREPPDDVTWRVPAVTIHDAPRLAWRGLLVDVARHFRTVDELKKLLDLMALHKLNILQWHLTDDQGWRIEI
jgi:hexosaminidase